ncbi:LacI family DNA-binding transcriptional regulator [Microbacterium aurantiacum]|uniref:LacI family DNA-binding transcriptional regulator n=1 Tax=Microbacterium aurantiacum TaxID=162393 RepID=UPI000C7F9E60|nr:LacI family DNA-binding transcriptional regulator [Microbacterium aurantiacum]
MGTGAHPRQTVTIAEIATRAGVSPGAVSFALNGRKGVSESTRARILLVADELGWAPGAAAKALTAKKTNSFGLVLARDPMNLGVESFFMQFFAGMESELSPRGYGLLLQVAPDSESELKTLRRWRTTRRVDGILLVDLHVDDPRAEYFAKHPEFPSVAVADPTAAPGLTSVWTDDAEAMREAVRALAALGHRRIARVAGLSELAHTQIRDAAFHEEIAALGCEGMLLRTDYSPEEGTRATERALDAEHPPTAFVYDNDIMAIASLGVFSRAGLRVPDDVSIIAWDDSLICRHMVPKLTTLSHDVVAFGAHAARRLFDVLGGATPAAYLDSTPRLEVRESTGVAHG